MAEYRDITRYVKTNNPFPYAAVVSRLKPNQVIKSMTNIGAPKGYIKFTIREYRKTFWDKVKDFLLRKQ